MELTKPFIVAVNGLAYGDGCKMVMLANMAAASEEATFSNPEMLFGGFVPITIALGLMLFDRKNAIEMIFTNKVLTAQEALRIDLVKQVVSSDQLREVITALTKKVMTSPTVLRVVRKLLSKQLEAYINDLEAAIRDLIIAGLEDFGGRVNVFLKREN
ncbi:MAG: enoyl-CoA hydratase/isomerase family protein [Candidatus Jordarchaeaceae archaeon]